jgi:hypothetical protein
MMKPLALILLLLVCGVAACDKEPSVQNARCFSLIVGDTFTFQAISRIGKIVDSGSLMRRQTGR